MTFEGIIEELQNKVYRPVYLLMGEEPYFIDEITDYITGNILTEQEKDFNLTVLYGKDINISTIAEVSRRYPLMSEHQVVVIKEAQNIYGLNLKASTDEDNEQELPPAKKGLATDVLIHYVQNPLKSTILVINYKYGTISKKSRLYQAINEAGIIFESKKLHENQAPTWINAYLKVKNITIDQEANFLLTEYLGNDLGKIVNELNKLIICLPPQNKKITIDQIELNIGISKDYNVFELRKALATKDILKSNRIIQYFANNLKDNPLILILTSLFQFFTKVLIYHQLTDKSKQNASAKLNVPVYFIYDFEIASRKYNAAKVIGIISLLRQYDMKLKGVDNNSTQDGDLLKELIYKILH
jgi:DNA polymerase-3 subunit delta